MFCGNGSDACRKVSNSDGSLAFVSMLTAWTGSLEGLDAYLLRSKPQCFVSPAHGYTIAYFLFPVYDQSVLILHVRLV